MSITIIGDVMIGRSFNQLWTNQPGYRCVSNDLQQWLEGSNLLLGNLETTITSLTQKWPNKKFNFKLDPYLFSSFLSSLKVNHFSLANNHILDYLPAGAIETMKTLNSHGISFTGVGSDLNHSLLRKLEAMESIAEAKVPVIKKINGLDIAIFSAADHPSEWAAGPNSFGIWYLNSNDISSQRSILNEIRSFRSQFSGLIILSVHWGPNYQLIPSVNIQSLAHSLIDAGVDIIHGHSAHHLQMYEEYFNPRSIPPNYGLIFYSLGDFIDDYMVDSKYRNDLSAAIRIKVFKNPVNTRMRFSYEIEYQPIKISSMFTDITSNLKEREFIAKLLYSRSV